MYSILCLQIVDISYILLVTRKLLCNLFCYGVYTMKKSPFIFLALAFSAVLLFVVLFPTAASGNDRGPDAVVGARMSYSYYDRSSYDVVASSHKGGSVLPSVSDSPYGERVQFSVAPAGGYEIASVSVISAGGNVLELKREGDVFDFTMPSESVYIDVTFQFARQ